QLVPDGLDRFAGAVLDRTHSALAFRCARISSRHTSGASCTIQCPHGTSTRLYGPIMYFAAPSTDIARTATSSDPHTTSVGIDTSPNVNGPSSARSCFRHAT